MKKKNVITLTLSIITLIALALIPLVIKNDSTINLVILILLYIMLASSWNILGGYTGQTNLGHAAFFGIGSLATRVLWIDGFPFLPVFGGRVVGVFLALLDRGAGVQIERRVLRDWHPGTCAHAQSDSREHLS